MSEKYNHVCCDCPSCGCQSDDLKIPKVSSGRYGSNCFILDDIDCMEALSDERKQKLLETIKGKKFYCSNCGRHFRYEFPEIDQLRTSLAEKEAEIELCDRREGTFRDAMGEHCGEESTVMAIAGMYYEIGTLKEQLAEKKKEVGELKEWVNNLHSGMYINCVYCGHRYGPNDEVPASMADVLKEHIENCPKHPMSLCKNALTLCVEEARGVCIRRCDHLRNAECEQQGCLTYEALIAAEPLIGKEKI